MQYDHDDDPLWLKSPVKRYAFRAACYLIFIALGFLLQGWYGAGAVLMCLIAGQHWIERGVSEIWHHWVLWKGRHEAGQHYGFAGQTIRIHDDRRELWIDAVSVRKLLGQTQDPALKARFANEWRESAELGLQGKEVWIKVAALHQYLGDAPERMDPRRLKLRAYLDRDVLQPHARKRERGL